MDEKVSENPGRNTATSFQNRFDNSFKSIDGICSNKKMQVAATRKVVMGDPNEWKFKDFQQPASDLLFFQNGKSFNLKIYLPGNYWVYLIRYSRKDFNKGKSLGGRSEGKYIYIPDFTDGVNPTQLEKEAANIIALLEAAHQVDDEINRDLYGKLNAKLSNVNKKEPEYMIILKEIKTRQELGSLELALDALKNMEKDGLNIFTGSSDQLRSILLEGLKSQGWLLDIELPKE
ncbi:MAG: hypothetical protein WC894_04440 [Patescibacteria group bacterium]